MEYTAPDGRLGYGHTAVIECPRAARYSPTSQAILPQGPGSGGNSEVTIKKCFGANETSDILKNQVALARAAFGRRTGVGANV